MPGIRHWHCHDPHCSQCELHMVRRIYRVETDLLLVVEGFYRCTATVGESSFEKCSSEEVLSRRTRGSG